MFLHILKRLALVMLGYLVGLLAGLVAAVLLYSAVSAIPGTPDYLDVAAIGAIAAVAVPVIGFFAYMLAAALTVTQAAVAALLSELLTLRSFWIHMLFGALSAIGGVLLLDEDSYLAKPIELAVIAASGAVAGLVYWAIAGRKAGFTRSAEV